MTRRRFAGAGAIALACALLAIPLVASAQTAALTTQIREISFDSKGHTNIVVSVAGPALAATQNLDASAFAVTEDGTTVTGLTAQSLSAAKSAVSLVLAMDVSSSMTGPKFVAAKAAAVAFVGSLPANVRVAILAFGSNVTQVQDFTTDHTVLDNGINALTIAGRTALFDALVQASSQLSRQLDAQHNVVLFTDGYEGDNNSKATLADAVGALKSSNAAATTVLLGAGGKGLSVLQQVVAAVKGGQSLQASDTSALNAAFARAAQGLTSQYVLSYAASDTATKELNIVVTATAGGVSASDQSVVLNGRSQVQAPAGGGLSPASKPLVGAFGGNLGLYLGLGAAFLGVLLFVGMLLYAPAGAAAERALQRRLRLYTRGGDRKKKQESTGGLLSGTSLGRSAVSLMERVPRRKGSDEKLQIELDKAGWPLRATELIIIQVGGFAAGMLIGWALFQRLWLGIVLAVVGAVFPRLILDTAIKRRTATFLTQLPDTLQLLAGSLQAGYGFLQALDTVAKEASPPTSTEFARVLSEARLGRPIVGSSRVDLQACKLEYSIVSPK